MSVWIVCDTCRTSCALHGPVALRVETDPPRCPSCTRHMRASTEPLALLPQAG